MGGALAGRGARGRGGGAARVSAADLTASASRRGATGFWGEGSGCNRGRMGRATASGRGRVARASSSSASRRVSNADFVQKMTSTAGADAGRGAGRASRARVRGGRASVRGRNAEDRSAGGSAGDREGSARANPGSPRLTNAPRAILKGLRTCVRGSPRCAGRSRRRARPAPTSSPARRSRGTEGGERRTSRLRCSRLPRRPAAERRRGVARAGFSCSPTRRNEKLPPSAGSPPRFARARRNAHVCRRDSLVRASTRNTRDARSRARRARGSSRAGVATPAVPPSEKAHLDSAVPPACRSIECSLSRETVDRETARSIGAQSIGVDRRNFVPPMR